MSASSMPRWLTNKNPSLFLQRAQSTLDVALQPITDIRSGIPNGFEALVRNTDQLGFSSISDFFDFADELRVFARIDRARLRRWHQRLFILLL